MHRLLYWHSTVQYNALMFGCMHAELHKRHAGMYSTATCVTQCRCQFCRTAPLHDQHEKCCAGLLWHCINDLQVYTWQGFQLLQVCVKVPQPAEHAAHRRRSSTVVQGDGRMHSSVC